jgi:hypothetical protein
MFLVWQKKWQHSSLFFCFVTLLHTHTMQYYLSAHSDEQIWTALWTVAVSIASKTSYGNASDFFLEMSKTVNSETTSVLRNMNCSTENKDAFPDGSSVSACLKKFIAYNLLSFLCSIPLSHFCECASQIRGLDKISLLDAILNSADAHGNALSFSKYVCKVMANMGEITVDELLKIPTFDQFAALAEERVISGGWY